MAYFIVVARGCHKGLLLSLDSLHEAMSLMPYPEGIKVSVPSVQVKERPGSKHGVIGKVEADFGGSVEIQTDPNEGSLIFEAKNISFRPKDEKMLYSFLYEHFGAKSLGLS